MNSSSFFFDIVNNNFPPEHPLRQTPQFYRPPRESRQTPVKMYKNDCERVEHLVDKDLEIVSYSNLEQSSVKTLKDFANFLGVRTDNFCEKKDFIQAIKDRRNEKCPVCMDDFKFDEKLKMTHCGHLYHEHCLQESAVAETSLQGVMPKCAICRSPLNKVNEYAGRVKRKNEAIENARKLRKV